jgi:hypothetical protein
MKGSTGNTVLLLCVTVWNNWFRKSRSPTTYAMCYTPAGTDISSLYKPWFNFEPCVNSSNDIERGMKPRPKAHLACWDRGGNYLSKQNEFFVTVSKISCFWWSHKKGVEGWHPLYSCTFCTCFTCSFEFWWNTATYCLFHCQCSGPVIHPSIHPGGDVMKRLHEIWRHHEIVNGQSRCINQTSIHPSIHRSVGERQ